MDSDRTIVTVKIDPTKWNTALTDLYATLRSALPNFIEPTCTQAQFVRMSRTLLLKRVQDVMEEQNFTRPENFVKLSRSIEVPAPIGDFLAAIGTYTSSVNGITYHIQVVDKPAAKAKGGKVDKH